MRTLITMATVLAGAALWCAAPGSADDDADNMERDAKAAGVTTDFKTGVAMGGLCAARGMKFVEMNDDEVIAGLVTPSRSKSEATAIWNIVKKNCS